MSEDNKVTVEFLPWFQWDTEQPGWVHICPVCEARVPEINKKGTKIVTHWRKCKEGAKLRGGFSK